MLFRSTFKIKKIYLYILLFVLVITFCGFGYYKWCARHPEIELQIVEIQFQHEGICSLLKEAYQSSDIQLDLSVKNEKQSCAIMEKPRHLQVKKKIMILKQNLILR